MITLELEEEEAELLNKLAVLGSQLDMYANEGVDGIWPRLESKLLEVKAISRDTKRTLARKMEAFSRAIMAWELRR